VRIRFIDKDLQRLYEEEGFRLPRYGLDLTKAFRKKVAVIDTLEADQDGRIVVVIEITDYH